MEFCMELRKLLKAFKLEITNPEGKASDVGLY